MNPPVLSDDPERGSAAFCALVANLRLLQQEVVLEVPAAEARISQVVSEAERVILAAWEGR